ncbi:unnamed protein product, partial [Scytosiphon promiscuus]
MGQPLFWLTISPADIHSPIVLSMAGVHLDVTSRLKNDFPDYAEKLRLVARDPVASALFYHAMIEAVVSCLLRFGASDGDGGVLGRVKGYVGMTEEQRRLSLHCHLLVWVFGYNDFDSFRNLMDKTPERYGELVKFLDRVIYNQVATLMRDPKECLPVPPPTACFPRGDARRCPQHDSAFARLMYLDLAGLTTGANLHKCQATCHKYNHRDSCRCGVVISSFTLLLYPDADADTDRFSVVLRRAHTHINSYNPIIQYCTRSNMDLKVMLRDGDAKGLLFYILNYSTKSEQTLDVLIPLLVPVVERIREESGGAPAKDLAVRLVRSCLCRQLSSLSIGGPAAASKVFGLPDAKLSH